MKRVLVGGALAAALGATAWSGAPAYADSTVVVHGTDFPSPLSAQISFTGCSGLYDRTAEVVQPSIGFGPGAVPRGKRSLKYDLAGGNAVGSLHYVGSMLRTSTASLGVTAPGGTTGVAYAGYQAPADKGTSLVWFGRAPLSVGPGGWQSVDVTGLGYTWTQYDVATSQPVTAATSSSATVAAFASAHGGDGPGLYTIGFGCDGAPFSIDAMRIGTPGKVTTYDLEGLATATAIRGTSRSIVAGGTLDVTGRLRQSAGGRLAEATMILERKVGSASDWRTVSVEDAAAADPTVTVEPHFRTTYRWRFADRPLAEASTSAPFVVDVATAVTARLKDRTLSGTTFPAKARVGLTLWHRVRGVPVAVKRGRTAADGSYAVTAPQLAGGGDFYVTVDASTGNTSGTSASLRLGGLVLGEPDPPATPTDPGTPSNPPSDGPSTPADPGTPSGPSTTPPATPADPSTPAPPSTPSDPTVSEPPAAPEPSSSPEVPASTEP